MKVSFNKYTSKDRFIIMINPAIAFGKENGTWFIGFAWLCFMIYLEF